MPVLKFDEVSYEAISSRVKRKLIHTGNLMTVLIDFSGGPWEEPDPPHSHPHEQTSYVAEGEIIFYCDGEEDQVLKQGDMFSVPPDREHCIKVVSETARLIDNFYPIREDFI
jgi:quercetin dioxygenase-like cupin family protein